MPKRKNKYPQGTNEIKVTPAEKSSLSGLDTKARTEAIRNIIDYKPKRYPAGSQAWKDQNAKFEGKVSDTNKGLRNGTLNIPTNGPIANQYAPGQLTEKIKLFKEGASGIHIKPENRGKFTAYKERTGKTTEEALHSEDPHVRQMANFARNAAKWHHADGTQGVQAGLPKEDLQAIAQRNKPMKKLRPTYAAGTEELGGGKPKTAKEQSAESKQKRAAAMGKKADNIDQKINQAAKEAPKNEYGAPVGDQRSKDVPKRKGTTPMPKFRSFAEGTKKLSPSESKGTLDVSKINIPGKEPKDPMIAKSREFAKTAKAPAATAEHVEEKKEAVAPKINVSSKADTDSMTFGQAFAHHRASGAKDFTWKGKKYTTQTKEEVSKPAAKPAVSKTSVTVAKPSNGEESKSTPSLSKAHKEANPNKGGGTKIEKAKPSKGDASGIGSAAKAVGNLFSDNDSDEDDNKGDMSGVGSALKASGKIIKKTLTGGGKYKEGTKKLKKGGKNMGC